MATQFVEGQRLEAAAVLGAALAMAERERVLSALLWNASAVVDFTEADGRKVNYRLPGRAVGDARTYTFDKNDGQPARPGPIVLDDIVETQVDIGIDTHLYKGTSITDEQLTWDIVNFSERVSQPLIDVMVKGFEQKALAGLRDAAANAKNSITYNPVNNNELFAFAVRARKVMRNNGVPGTIYLAYGSDVEEAVLLDERVSKVQSANPATAQNAFAEALAPTTVAGIQPIAVPFLNANEAYVLVPTAVALTNVAPPVPEGASFGESATYNGVSMRLIRDYDPNYLRDRIVYSMFCGAQSVNDGRGADAGTNVRVIPVTFGSGTNGTVA